MEKLTRRKSLTESRTPYYPPEAMNPEAMNPEDEFRITRTETIPPCNTAGRRRGTYSGLSATIRALETGKGFEMDAPDKAKERSLRSMVCAISITNGCHYTVRLSNNRQTIGVYRLK